MKKFLILLITCGFCSVASAATFKVGDRVECNWKQKGTNYPGKITSLQGNKAHIAYDDGDQEDTTTDLCNPVARLDPSNLKVGDRVECNWKTKGTNYPGKITTLQGNNVHIVYDDGDEEDTTLDLCSPTSSRAKTSSNSSAQGNCHFKGKPLYGKVQFVTAFPDVRVQVVTAIPDLRVQMVTALPNSCGKWQETTSLPDLKVQIVDSLPDIKIQYVTSFPGK